MYPQDSSRDSEVSVSRGLRISQKKHKKSFDIKNKGSAVLELLGSQILEGSLVLAESGRIKESQGLSDANLCLR